MTKVLYVDISLRGHRKKYIEELSKINDLDNYEVLTLLPSKAEISNIKQYELKSNFDKKRTIFSYIKFIIEIRKIVIDNQIDIIHFLCGDALYRYFGFLLSILKKKIIITYHHVLYNGFKKYSIKRLFKKSTQGIVHTEELYKKLKSNNIKNCYLVDYPMLDNISTKSINEAKNKFNLPKDVCVLGMIGGTSKYKGMEFLINALNNLDCKCCLFVAGAVDEYNYDYIRNKLKNDKIILVTKLEKLSDIEFADAIQASDVIILPYRKEFDGASGILIESLFHNKYIIGSNHGSMGDLIKKYNLGTSFETDDVDSLIKSIKDFIEQPKMLSNESNEYKIRLKPQSFIESYRKIYEKEN